MSNINKVAKSLKKSIQSDKQTKPYDTQATVNRIEGQTAWVQIPGGVDETPVKLTTSAKPGDVVQVRVSGGRAWLTGNETAPPTDDTRAIKADATAASAKSVADSAMNSANIAADAAGRAITSASQAATAASAAQTSANNALTSAKNASDYASRALGNLSTVQSVAETLTYITAHGTMTLTTDVAIDPTHVYFVVDPAGDYTVNSVKYSIVTEPNVANIGTYYELSIDESLQNYVGTHLALTQEGLWLLPAASGTNKVLIATGAGTQYTTAGTYIIGSSGETLARFAQNGLNVTTKSGNNIVEIANLGYGLGNADSGTAEAPYYTLGIRKSGEAVGNYSVAEGKETTASALGSHAEGGNTNISLVWYYLTASGTYSHAEGGGTTASGRGSHAEGYLTTASGDYSHAEGGYISSTMSRTTASGRASHAEGTATTASGGGSHAQNYGTIAQGQYQTAIGKYNVAQGTTDSSTASDHAFIIGNGTSSTRSNALTVDWSGNVDIASGAKYKINGTNLSASDVGAVPTSDISTNGANNTIPKISGNVLNINQYIDFKANSSTAPDYDLRLSTDATTTGTSGTGFLHINGQPMKDFVVGGGTSSSWYYRKWNSGKVEAWRTYDAGSQTPSQWVTGWYYKDINVAIPSGIFSATPTHVVATNIGSDYQYSVFTACPTSSTSIKVRVVKPNSGAATPVLSIYASNMI